MRKVNATYRLGEKEDEEKITSFSRYQTRASNLLHDALYVRNIKPAEEKKRKAEQLSINLKRSKR